MTPLYQNGSPHGACVNHYTAPMHKTALSLIVLAGLASLAIAQPTDSDTRVETLWAGPDKVANPVAFTIDRFGNLYIVESFRAGNAVTDTRNIGHLNGVEEDLQLHSVEDRLALINKWIAGESFEPDFFTRTEDRVVRVRDTDGDGVADDSNVFADGFNDPLDGIAAGALWVGDTLLLTNIPNLWALRDADGDGTVDERESLAYGFGVRWCFYGHDLHGLVQGPDGRVYFSMGDRGFNVTTKEGNQIVNPQTGGVFRCWPDGSELELFAQGLRNPQELAFDEFGNLFTGDNNCDSGDKARVVHVVEGGDCGWRQDVQSLDSRGPWNREKIWHTYDNPKDIDRPAWTLPPVAHVGAGPSGILYYPGTGENSGYDDHIFMVDFYGSGATIHTFRMEPAGAWFSMQDKGVYYKGKTVTDIAFGYDGRMYLSDWGGGWQPNPNGSVFTIENTTVSADIAEQAAINEVRTLFAKGFDSLNTETLVGLLAHRDQRVRLAAQYELANADRDAAAIAESVAIDNPGQTPLLARIHAVWLLSQIARRDDGVLPTLRALLNDTDADVRTQAVKMLADLRDAEPAARYVELLSDENQQVRSFAALALGKIGYAPAMGPLLDMLDANDDKDPVIRHMASYALSLINRPDDLVDAAASHAEGGRIGAVIALRRLKNLGLLAFVRDENPRVAAEAIRAIYDERVDAGLPAVARLLDTELPKNLRVEPVLRRAVSANVLIGDAESARRLANFTTWSDLPPVWRKTTLESLLAWDAPLKREGVWGHWVDLPARDESVARSAVVAVLPALEALRGADGELDKEIEFARARFGADLSPDAMFITIADMTASPDYRGALLDRLSTVAPDRLAEAAEAALADASPASEGLRMHARALLVRTGNAKASAVFEDALRNGSAHERQQAVAMLAEINDAESAEMLASLAAGLKDGKTDPSIALEVIEATTVAPGESHGANGNLATAADDPRLAPSVLAAGGDPAAGADIFMHHAAAQCLRCHTIDGSGGTAGPNLSAVGSRLPSSRIIESLLNPNAVVADGYGTISLRLEDGKAVGGILLEEKPGVYIVDSMGVRNSVPKDLVTAKIGPTSAMPMMTAFLSPHEIRDVIAFLSARQDPAVGAAPEPGEASGDLAHASAVGGGGNPSGGISMLAIVMGLVAIGAVVLLVVAIRVGSGKASS